MPWTYMIEISSGGGFLAEHDELSRRGAESAERYGRKRLSLRTPRLCVISPSKRLPHGYEAGAPSFSSVKLCKSLFFFRHQAESR